VINRIKNKIFGQKSYKYKALENNYDDLKKSKKLIICINVGRSGTRWLADIFDKHHKVIGTCERIADMESFYRFVKWYDLNIDLSGVINTLKDSIVQDWEHNDTSMIVSPYLSHDFNYLYNELKPDYVIWGVNNPKFTVTSFYNKGWYEEYDTVKNSQFMIPGLTPSRSINQSLGRIIPKDDFFYKWLSFTRVGKISWLYNAVNMEIFESLKQIPKEKIYIFKLEDADQNYEFYLDLAKRFNLLPLLSKKDFLNLKGKTVRKKDNKVKEWTQEEVEDFERETKFIADVYKNELNSYAQYLKA
jgi:hypothetical protein